jgi:hypothetical protein
MTAATTPRLPGNETSTVLDYALHDGQRAFLMSSGDGENDPAMAISHWPRGENPIAIKYGYDAYFAISAAPQANIDYPLRSEMEQIGALQMDWDGPGALAPAPAAVRGAREFLKSLGPREKLPEVSAGRDGEVNISWRDERSYVDLSFYRSGGASLYARVDGEIFKIRSGVHLVSDLPPRVFSCVSMV